MGKKAVILLSGGLDSTTLMAIAKQEGYELYALTFRYGQRHENEIICAKKVASVFNAKEHLIFDIDLAKIGGSSLTTNAPVPKERGINEISASIPSTYVPARNTIFLSIALAWAETIGSRAVFIGVNSIDWSGYPDCRPEYIRAFQNMADLATKTGVEDKEKIKIFTPLINMAKGEIIRKGISLGVDYSLTHSCYDPLKGEGNGSWGKPCGACDSCLLRKKGFAEAGVIDPLS